MAINNITVKESKEGNLYVDMPSYKAKQLDDQGRASYKDICNPVTAKFNEKLNSAVLQSYEAAKNKERDSVLNKLQEKTDDVKKRDAKAPEKEQHQPSRDEATR